MMEPHDAGRVDQHVAALLGGVGPGHPGKPALQRLASIGSHGGEAPQVPEPRLAHTVGSVVSPVGVDQQRPVQPGLVQILAGLVRWFERDDERMDLEPLELLARLLQLQQVSAAGQSEQMPVEHQQHPPAAVVFEPMLPARDVPQGKGHGLAADEP